VTRASWGVLDASVAVKCLLREVDSPLALEAVATRSDWIAPDFIFLEIASVARKALQRGLIQRAQAEAMLEKAPRLLVETVAAEGLRATAFRLAADHAFSVYDSAYLALAQLRGGEVLTADARLVQRARAAGLTTLVRPLSEA
jgi:predicted nucleic acid-binding protein